MAADTEKNDSMGSSPQIFNPAAGYLNSEGRRSLDSPTFGTAPSSVDIPRDTCIKRMGIQLNLKTQVTYAAGSPTVSPQGAFARVCSNLEVNIGGTRFVKSVDPYLAKMTNILMGGNVRQSSSSSAGAITASRAAADLWTGATLAYQATTGYMFFQEMVELSFENPFGYGGSRYLTELDTRDVSSATLKFTWNPIENLQTDGVGATVTYANVSCVMKPHIITNNSRPRPEQGQVLFDYVESVTPKQVSAAGAQSLEIQSGNFLQALGLLARNGDTSLTFQEEIITGLALKINGATAIQGPIDMQELQDNNLIRYNTYSPRGAGGINRIRGFALMNLIRNGDWNTAINTSRAGGVDTVRLEFNATSEATYTAPVMLYVHKHEIRPYTYAR